MSSLHVLLFGVDGLIILFYQVQAENRDNILELEEKQLALSPDSTVNGGSPMQALGTDPQDEVQDIVPLLVEPIQFTKKLSTRFIFEITEQSTSPQHVSFVFMDGTLMLL